MFKIESNLLAQIEDFIVDYIPNVKELASHSSTTVYGCDTCTGCNPCTGVV